MLVPNQTCVYFSASTFIFIPGALFVPIFCSRTYISAEICTNIWSKFSHKIKRNGAETASSNSAKKNTILNAEFALSNQCAHLMYILVWKNASISEHSCRIKTTIYIVDTKEQVVVSDHWGTSLWFRHFLYISTSIAVTKG